MGFSQPADREPLRALLWGFSEEPESSAAEISGNEEGLGHPYLVQNGDFPLN